jgi:hypothetical protein
MSVRTGRLMEVSSDMMDTHSERERAPSQGDEQQQTLRLDNGLERLPLPALPASLVGAHDLLELLGEHVSVHEERDARPSQRSGKRNRDTALRDKTHGGVSMVLTRRRKVRQTWLTNLETVSEACERQGGRETEEWGNAGEGDHPGDQEVASHAMRLYPRSHTGEL